MQGRAVLSISTVKNNLVPSGKANDIKKAFSYLKNCVPEKSSKSFRIFSVDSGYKRKIQAEIKDLKHTMDYKQRKGDGGGKTYLKEGPNKKLLSRQKKWRKVLGDREADHCLPWLHLQGLAITKS